MRRVLALVGALLGEALLLDHAIALMVTSPVSPNMRTVRQVLPASPQISTLPTSSVRGPHVRAFLFTPHDFPFSLPGHRYGWLRSSDQSCAWCALGLTHCLLLRGGGGLSETPGHLWGFGLPGPQS